MDISRLLDHSLLFSLHYTVFSVSFLLRSIIVEECMCVCVFCDLYTWKSVYVCVCVLCCVIYIRGCVCVCVL